MIRDNDRYYIQTFSALTPLPPFLFQEETMGEARQVETEAATYLDQVSRYFISRAKLISKVAKYPHIVSFKVPS